MKINEPEKVMELRKCCRLTIQDAIEDELFLLEMCCGCNRKFRVLTENVFTYHDALYKLVRKGKKQKIRARAKRIWCVTDGVPKKEAI